MYPKIHKYLVLFGLAVLVSILLTGCTFVTDNQPPNAKISYDEGAKMASEIVEFSSLSSDDDGSIVTHEWEFGDGETAEGKNVSHIYNEDGFYNVSLRVTDDGGLTDTTSVKVEILNPPPEPSLSYLPEIPIIGELVEFDAGASFDPAAKPLKYIQNYNWYFEDETKSGVRITKTFYEAGMHEVTLELQDDDGAYAATTKQVEVQAPPVAQFSWNSWVDCSSTSKQDESENKPQLEPVPCDLVVEFDANGSYDPYHNNIQEYIWSFGDGSTTNTQYETITHRFNDPTETYEVTLTVRDRFGLERSTTKDVYDQG